MADTYISLYLKAHRIRVYVDVLRALGSPKRICFMIEERCQTFLVAPYENKDFKSHEVPASVYTGSAAMEISSIRLCTLIAKFHGWNGNYSYRVPRKYHPKHNVMLFQLAQAGIIEHGGKGKD